jgi:hypothetical protein
LAVIILEEEAIQCVMREANKDRPKTKKTNSNVIGNKNEALHTINSLRYKAPQNILPSSYS